MVDRNRPTQNQISDYLNWLEAPEGDAHLQMPLPLGAEINTMRSPDSRDATPQDSTAVDVGETEKRNLTASQAVARIRTLAIAGLSVRDISIQVGCDERFVETVIYTPGKINRRYE